VVNVGEVGALINLLPDLHGDMLAIVNLNLDDVVGTRDDLRMV
jgi:hypothetical protein